MKKNLFILIILSMISCENNENQSFCSTTVKNLENAYEQNDNGCGCENASEKNICIEDENGHKIALACENDTWITVEDGACYEPE